MGRFVPVARVQDLPSGSAGEYTTHGRIIALFHVDGRIYALDGICPHAGGPLGQGTLQGCVVTCPWHGWQFDVTTGAHGLNPRIRQAGYPVRLVGDEIQVELPEE